MLHDFGFLILAFGKQRYIDQAVNLAISLKRHMGEYPIAIVTDHQSLPKNLFDTIIPLDRAKGGGFIQKLWLDVYSPFEKTLFVDSDCIVGQPFHEQLNEIAKFPFSPVCERYLEPGDVDEDGWVVDIGSALSRVGGSRYPKFNGGIYYFDKSASANAVFEKARLFAGQAESLGLKNPSGGEVGDETVFALALSALGQVDLYDDHGLLMRTPIGITGPFRMDKNFGRFEFKKSGQRVQPAICHFAGANVSSLSYMKIEDFGRFGHPSLLKRTTQRLRYVRYGWPHYLRRLKQALASVHFMRAR